MNGPTQNTVKAYFEWLHDEEPEMAINEDEYGTTEEFLHDLYFIVEEVAGKRPVSFADFKKTYPTR